jgi:hypothetical protein
MTISTRNHLAWTGLFTFLILAAATASARAQGSESSSSNVDYIDNAIPGNQVRLRYDAAYDINRSDRALYLYSRGAYPKVDYQDLAPCVELAFGQRFSAFVEMHGQSVHPVEGDNATGLGDMNVGGKWAFLFSDDRVATLQLRTYIPTGNPDLVLGNGHASFEPGLLLYQRLSDRWLFEGEFKDWIPLTDDNFRGNILNYGAGLSLEAYRSCKVTVCPVLEMFGWTVLSGKETVVPPTGIPPLVPPVENTNGFPIKSAAGDTIINAKMGVRFHLGEHGDFYAGYGRALTGDVWYKNILRIEYRLSF